MLPHQFSKASRSKLYIYVSLIIAALVFFWRLHVFGDLEPRGDQAFKAWWINGLIAADHIIPRQDVGESILDALARDETGFLTQIFRPIYNSPTHLFEIIPIMFNFILTKFLGNTYSIHVGISLLVSVMIPFTLTFFPFWRKRAPALSADYMVGFLAMFVATISAYLHIFSGWGFHNYGILSLVVAIMISMRILSAVNDFPTGRMSWQAIIVLFFANGFAIYSYKTNLFLLPPATVLAITVLPSLNWRHKLHHIFTYSTIIAVLILPFIPFLITSIYKPDFSQNLTSPFLLMDTGPTVGFLNWLTSIAKYAQLWIMTAQELYSLPGLALGIVGLIVMARDGLRLPLCLVITHFLAWCFVPLFAASSLRTYPYIIPFLALGAGYFIIISFRGTLWSKGQTGKPIFRKHLTAATASILITAHIALQIPTLSSREHISKAVPLMWELYYSDQGKLRPMIEKIERALPADAVLMTWGYGLQFLFRSLTTSNIKIEIPALNALMLRHKAGLLQEHLRKRHLSLSAVAPKFILVDHAIDHIDRQALIGAVATLLGPKGFKVCKSLSLVKLENWHFQSSWPKDVVLYKVVIDKQ